LQEQDQETRTATLPKQQVCIQPRPTAVSMALPAFSAERTWRRQLSIDLSCPHGAQQQTHRWDRQTDGRTLDRYVKRCFAHYAGSVSKISAAAAAAAAAVVFGCAYPALPSDMHIAATSVDTVRIQCNGTDESWTLSCVADTWVGLIGNCTVSE